MTSYLHLGPLGHTEACRHRCISEWRHCVVARSIAPCCVALVAWWRHYFWLRCCTSTNCSLLAYLSWSKAGTLRHCQSKEASILWSYHEETRELPGERDNARNNARCTQARKTTHGLDGTSRRGQDSPWKSQSEFQRTEINGESTSMVWPTLGSKTAKEQNSLLTYLLIQVQRARGTGGAACNALLRSCNWKTLIQNYVAIEHEVKWLSSFSLLPVICTLAHWNISRRN